MPPPTTKPALRDRAPRAVPAALTAFSQALPWLLTSVAMTMSSLIGQVPAWALLVFAACVAWRYVVEHRKLALPNFATRVLVFVPMTLAVLWTYGTRPSAPGMLTFLVALMSLKVLELRSPRDFTVVSLLGYFMTLSAFFYSQTLLISLYLGLALLLNSVALIRGHGGKGRGNMRAAFRLGTIMILQSLPLVVLLFIIFPRLQGTFLRRLGGDPQGLTGMSEHLQPGSFSSLAQSTETAFRARILTPGPAITSSQLYWRGLVMDICEHGLSWRSSEAPLASGDVPGPPPGTRRIEQQITQMPQGERWMFALDHPVAVLPNSEVRAALTAANVLRSATPLVSKAIYTAVSDLSPQKAQELTAGRRKFYTTLPEDISPRTIALAQGWHQSARSEPDIVRLALDFFRAGHFSYTLTPGAFALASGLDTFLFNRRSGFCEHYAAAFATLMRAAGLPARIVVGYQGGEYNTWGGHYLVRQSDAHAWVEVWLEGGGWQRVDPTGVVAPDRVSFGANDYSTLMAEGPLTEESRLDRLRRIHAPSTLRWIAHNALLAWDGLDQQWNITVLSYDQEQQWILLGKLGVGDLSWLGGTALTLVLVFALLAIGALSFRVLDRRGTADTVDRERRWYLRFCRRLAAAGGPQPAAGEGPLNYARRAVAALPDAAAEIGRITELYVALRYGRPGAGGAPDRAGQFRAAVAAFRPACARR